MNQSSDFSNYSKSRSPERSLHDHPLPQAPEQTTQYTPKKKRGTSIKSFNDDSPSTPFSPYHYEKYNGNLNDQKTSVSPSRSSLRSETSKKFMRTVPISLDANDESATLLPLPSAMLAHDDYNDEYDSAPPPVPPRQNSFITPVPPKHSSPLTSPTKKPYNSDVSVKLTSDSDSTNSIEEEKEAACLNNLHFGPPPSVKQPRRFREMRNKSVPLVRGHLTLDCPIPSKLRMYLPRQDDTEFTNVRYTAATCEADEFVGQGYALRQNMLGRETELLIGVTVYNEDETLLTRTLHGIFQNIAHLCTRSKSRVWGNNGWKKIVVCILADGRHKIHQQTLNVLSSIGVYQDGIAKNFVNGDEVVAHIFEYTAQLSLDSDLNFKGAEKGLPPVQIVFCMKEKNQKKISSHKWLFNAFCPALNPNVVTLIDVGTKPLPTSIYHLWKAFDEDSNVGGACGEIQVMKGSKGANLLNPIVAAQNFEYKVANQLDKPMESVFGFISVLPGAFSAYRYIAIKDYKEGAGPLATYFKDSSNIQKKLFNANMYLAEDRILCFELLTKPNQAWILRYVHRAKGVTDVPEDFAELLTQRRRWLNGSIFTSLYTICHFRRMKDTDHSKVRKFFFHIEFIYHLFSLFFTLASLANFYIFFYYINHYFCQGPYSPFRGGGELFANVINQIYILTLALQFLLSLGNKPHVTRGLFLLSLLILTGLMFYLTIIILFLATRGLMHTFSHTPPIYDGFFYGIVVSLFAFTGTLFLVGFLYMDPWHLFTSFIQSMILTPFFNLTCPIYAFCNLHDVSWGTKGELSQPDKDLGSATLTEKGMVEVEMPAEQQDIDTVYNEALESLRESRLGSSQIIKKTVRSVDDYQRDLRTRLVALWFSLNLILTTVVTSIYKANSGSNPYMMFMIWTTIILYLFRFLGSIIHLMLSGLNRVSRVFQARKQVQRQPLNFNDF